MLKDKAKNGSDEGSLNELAASIASKLVRNAIPLADPQPSVPQEGGSFVERQDANISASQGAETVLLDQPPRREESADEYRRRAGPMRVSAGREKPQATTFALPALL